MQKQLIKAQHMYIMLIFYSSYWHFYKCLFFYFLDNMNKLYPVPTVESNNTNLSNLNYLSVGGAVSHETFCRHDGRCWTQRGLWGKGASFSRSLTGSYLLQISIFVYIKLTTKKIYTKIFYLMPTSEQKMKPLVFVSVSRTFLSADTADWSDWH